MSELKGATEPTLAISETGDIDTENLWMLATHIGLNTRLNEISRTARNQQVSEIVEKFETDVEVAADVNNDTRILDLSELSFRVSLLNSFNKTGNQNYWGEMVSRIREGKPCEVSTIAA